MNKHGGRNWKKIAESLTNKTDVQCLHRWQKVGRRGIVVLNRRRRWPGGALTFADAWMQVLNPDLVKGPWRKEEDDKVRELVAMHGAKKWSFISSHLPGRIGKQCRERCAYCAIHCSWL